MATSTSALIFSRDRACQLDLLLRSIQENAPSLYDSVTVLWQATHFEFDDGYAVCKSEHDWVNWVEQIDFMTQTLDLLDEAHDCLSFLTDDSVFYRPLNGLTKPSFVLDNADYILCFSLRLGLHTGTCYPLMRLQGLPAFQEAEDILVWPWRTGDADFGYMGSVDGHVFRKEDMLDMIDGSKRFKNPNQLEEILSREVHGSHRDHAACHRESHLVGIPANRVNETHPNRFGDYHEAHPDALNRLYLDGSRIRVDSVKANRVTAAHAEMEFHFE